MLEGGDLLHEILAEQTDLATNVLVFDLVEDLERCKLAGKLATKQLLALGNVLGVVGTRTFGCVGLVSDDGDFIADLLDEVEEFEDAYDGVVHALLAATEGLGQRFVGVALGGRHFGPWRGVLSTFPLLCGHLISFAHGVSLFYAPRRLSVNGVFGQTCLARCLKNEPNNEV